MRVELMPGLTNVLRFPTERRARPTLELLRDIAPDPREVDLLAEAFDMSAPVDGLRHFVDREAAEHITNTIVPAGPARAAALDALLAPMVTAAVEACRAAHDMSMAAAEAQQVLLDAQTSSGHFWIEPLRERAEARTQRAAELLLKAHRQAELAEGVARAVDFARRGERWVPWSLRADEAAAFGFVEREAG